MNATYIFETGKVRSDKHTYEEDIARRWWALPLRINLPLSNGESCQLLYAGRPGSSPGPDIRDAILSFTSCHSETGYTLANIQQTAENAVGDVEIHTRATDWFAHQHHTDVRYNNVVLHIVLICDNSRPTLRQDGTIIPTCSLNDISSTIHTHQQVKWPCHHVIAQIHEEELTRVLALAGTLRFETKAQVFFDLLRDAQPTEIFSTYDVCLIPALAEALGFGRDRAFFRAAGLHLIGVVKTIPEPLGRTPKPSPLDANRLHMLRKLVEQWRITGAWNTLRHALLRTNTHYDYQIPQTVRSSVEVDEGAPTWIMAVLQQLRTIFDGLGMARTDILICNIVLPFAAAVAQKENDPILAEYARNFFITYPGPSSNQITRAMCNQLLLKNEPIGACQQQGLHFIYAQTCREKRCNDCLLGKQDM